MSFERDIAQRIVNTCLRIQPGEMVLINAHQHTITMAEAIAVACYQTGAVPLILFDSDDLFRAYCSEVPEEHLERAPAHFLRALEKTDAVIQLSQVEDPRVFDAGPVSVSSAFLKANKPSFDLARQRRIREIGLGWSMCTPQRARQYGVDYAAWRSSLANAMQADYSEIAAVGKQVGAILEKGRQVRLTAGDQTHLEFRLLGRKAVVDDGIIDQEDLARGGRYSEFPAGQVSVAPDEDSANGTVVFPRLPLWGKLLRNVRWTFENGRLVSWDAEEHGDVFEDALTSSTGEYDRFGLLSVGLNPHATPVGFVYLDMLMRGAVMVAIGDNQDFGGTVNSTVIHNYSLPHATLEVDGLTIIQNGRLTIPEQATATS